MIARSIAVPGHVADTTASAPATRRTKTSANAASSNVIGSRSPIASTTTGCPVTGEAPRSPHTASQSQFRYCDHSGLSMLSFVFSAAIASGVAFSPRMTETAEPGARPGNATAPMVTSKITSRLRPARLAAVSTTQLASLVLERA